MDGCGRLRTVADDCEQLRTVRRRGANTPSTPRPPVKGEPLLRIRGKSLYTEELLHTEAGTQRNFYAQKLLSAQRSFYTEAFTHRSCYAKKLYTETFTHKGFHTQNLYTEELLHTEVFTHRRVYTQYLFSQRSFYVEKSLHIFHDVSCFIIIHHLSFSYFRLPALSVNSLLLFFPATRLFSFRFARCSVRPRFVLAPSAAKQTKREPRHK